MHPNSVRSAPRCLPLLLTAAAWFAPCADADVQAAGAQRIASDAAGAGAFGAATAVLDFDGDGQDDLAIADPAETLEGGSVRGVVRLLRRDVSGWTPFSEAALNSGSALFGLTLAVADFDADGRDDLLIGAPGAGNGGGAVYLLRHSGPASIQQVGVILNSGAEFGACGSSLAVGQFNNDSHVDFATGCPTASFDGFVEAGRVQIGYGSGTGTFSMSFVSQASAGVDGSPETGDRFGAALAAGHFNCDLVRDLAIGVPGESVDGGVETGALHVLFGSAAGLTGDASQLWHQGSAGVPGSSGHGDRFAATLAAGNFDNALGLPPCSDLAVGIPDDAESPGGAVLVMQGSGSGLVSAGARLITAADFAPDPLQFPPHPAPGSEHALGVTLLSADIGRGAASDLVIAAEGYTPVLGSERPGVVCVAYGGDDVGLFGAGHHCFSGAQFAASAATDASFGFALASGPLDDASGRELVIGAPGGSQAFVLVNGLFADGFESTAD